MRTAIFGTGGVGGYFGGRLAQAGEDVNTAEPSVNAIIGALADTERRRLLAALELGAATLRDAAKASGLTEGRAAKALARLVDSHLVATDADGGLRVNDHGFRRAASGALARPPSVEHVGQPQQRRKVLEAFVRDGRITSMPTAAWKRDIVLDWLAATFEIGRHYSEVDVNATLEGHAEDHVTLRRALVDAGLLDRAGGEYWRCGGSIE